MAGDGRLVGTALALLGLLRGTLSRCLLPKLSAATSWSDQCLHATFPYLRILVHPRSYFTARRMRRCPWARISWTARSTASQHGIVHGVVSIPRTARSISWHRILQGARLRILPAVSITFARRIVRYLFAEEALEFFCKFSAHASSGALRRYRCCTGY